jgi:hypothetical protein
MNAFRVPWRRSVGWSVAVLAAANVLAIWIGPLYWLLPTALIDLVTLMLVFEVHGKK